MARVTVSVGKQRRNIEAAIQRELIRWLHSLGLEVVWIRNEGEKGAITAGLDSMSGLIPGFPDLIIFKQIRSITHLLHLELKKQKGALSPSQKKWHGEFIPSDNRKLATAYGLIHAQSIVTNWLESIA